MVFIFESTSVGIVPLLKGITGQPRVRAGVVVVVLHRGSIDHPCLLVTSYVIVTLYRNNIFCVCLIML